MHTKNDPQNLNGVDRSRKRLMGDWDLSLTLQAARCKITARFRYRRNQGNLERIL